MFKPELTLAQLAEFDLTFAAVQKDVDAVLANPEESKDALMRIMDRACAAPDLSKEELAEIQLHRANMLSKFDTHPALVGVEGAKETVLNVLIYAAFGALTAAIGVLVQKFIDWLTKTVANLMKYGVDYVWGKGLDPQKYSSMLPKNVYEGIQILHRDEKFYDVADWFFPAVKSMDKALKSLKVSEEAVGKWTEISVARFETDVNNDMKAFIDTVRPVMEEFFKAEAPKLREGLEGALSSEALFMQTYRRSGNLTRIMDHSSKAREKANPLDKGSIGRMNGTSMKMELKTLQSGVESAEKRLLKEADKIDNTENVGLKKRYIEAASTHPVGLIATVLSKLMVPAVREYVLVHSHLARWGVAVNTMYRECCGQILRAIKTHGTDEQKEKAKKQSKEDIFDYDKVLELWRETGLSDEQHKIDVKVERGMFIYKLEISKFPSDTVGLLNLIINSLDEVYNRPTK